MITGTFTSLSLVFYAKVTTASAADSTMPAFAAMLALAAMAGVAVITRRKASVR